MIDTADSLDPGPAAPRLNALRGGYGRVMGSESQDWSVPASVRALLWWPAIAFILVAIDPETSPAAIAAVGALLVVLGALNAAVAGVVRERAAIRVRGQGRPGG